MSSPPAGTTVDAPVTAVTVYPDRARVTRQATVRLPPGTHQVVVDGLPDGLHADSVRVSGRGPATVLGVDVARRRRPRATEAAVRELEDRARTLRARLLELADDLAVQDARLAFLDTLASRAGRSYAGALADGSLGADGVRAFTATLGAELAEVRAGRRSLTADRERVAEELAATDRELGSRRAQRPPDRRAVTVTLEVAAEEDTALEVGYVVDGAGWQPVYDVRLDEGRAAVHWYALVTQRTGEDWPECDLRLSTARPSGSTSVPELRPWYLDRARPPQMRAVPLGFAGGSVPPPAAPMRESAVADAVAAVEQGPTAATYAPTRPVAVPADGSAHRATIAVLDLEADLDHITAPRLGVEAYLRATLVNTSAHTLMPGSAAVFHGADFTGSAALPVWAPGEEVELSLGVDDRVRVERELVRRAAGKALLGGVRRRDAAYRTTVANHTPHPVRLTVLDQVPVSRDEGIVVRDVRCEPEPDERTDLGELTWRAELPPGGSIELTVGFRVELGRGVEMTGWRD